MDELDGLSAQWYPRKLVSTFLASYEAQRNDKKVTELEVGWLLAEHLYRNGGVETLIGFPLAESLKQKEPKPGHDIEQFVVNPALIRDTDYDILLGLADRNALLISGLIEIEITRIVPKQQQLPLTWESVASAIDNKLLRQPDENIWLVVSIEERVHIELDPLREHLESCQVPYGYIYMLGSVDESPRKFQVFELYPDVGKYREYEIPPVSIK